MESVNYTEISMDDYIKIESKIDSIMSEEKLIETHKNLIGKTCKNYFHEIKDCGVDFIGKFLTNDRRTVVYEYSKGAKKFIKSKYLSDYFKTSIRKLLSNEELSEVVLNALNSDKLINDMSEEEILAIYSAIKGYYGHSPIIDMANAGNYFMQLLYKLDGEGVISFIKNNVSTSDLARYILSTSGLNESASYYSGRGCNYGDLNENHLVAIFNKLFKIDADYATNFAEMVYQMKTLGATEFINSFMDLAANGFKMESLKTEDSNISLDGVYGKARDAVAFGSIFSKINIGNDQVHQIKASEQTKKVFMARITPIIQSINSNCYESNSQSFESNNRIRRR